MQAIEVKFYCDLNGNAKAKATCQSGSKVFFRDCLREEIKVATQYDNCPNLNDAESIAYYAALHLARKFNWDWSENYGNMVMGSLKNGNYVFTFTGRENCYVIK